ncbi:MAG: PIN domain-containing protein [Anaerolineales bacterium]|jgi:predicted nucleic acid-binding protein
MNPGRKGKPRVFVDSDVLFAGSASPSEHGASLIVLRLAELTLIETIASEQVIAEAQRNLAERLPKALPAFQLLVSRCLRVVPDPSQTEVQKHGGQADPKDLPILVAALREKCEFLVTFNIRHYQPGHPDLVILRPGEFILRIRDLLAQLSEKEA